MNCPNCGLQIADPRLPNCPRCGQPLHASAPEQQSQPGASAYPSYPGYGPQPMTPAPPNYGAPPSAPPSYGDQTQTPYPPAGYGQQPAGGQPGYPGYPGYGQPAAPSAPFYGQPSGPSVPMYGQPNQPTSPYYSQGVPGGYPVPQQPGYPASQPQRGRNLVIIGILVASALVLCIGGFVTLAYIGSHSASPTGAGTTSGTTTPGEQIVFQDALTSASHDDNWPNDTNCSFASDGYHIKDSYLCYAPAGNIGDGTISVQVAQARGDTTEGYGLVLRRASRGNYYIFAIDSSGEWAFYKFVNDTGTAIKDFAKSPALQSGLNARNTIKVTMKGTSFTFYANGTQLGEATDSAFTTGKSGVSGGSNLEVIYTTYKVTK